MIKFISVFNKVIVVLFLLSLIFVVFLQVFARVLLPQTPSWTEELARFSLIYLVASATGITFQQKLFVNVDLIFHIKKINDTVLLWIRGITQFIIFSSSLIMAIYSFPIIRIGFAQTSPALLMPMYIIFFTMFLIPASIILVQIYNLTVFFRRKEKDI